LTLGLASLPQFFRDLHGVVGALRVLHFSALVDEFLRPSVVTTRDAFALFATNLTSLKAL